MGCTRLLILAGCFNFISAISFVSLVLEYLGCEMILSTSITYHGIEEVLMMLYFLVKFETPFRMAKGG